jgi:hypothetical protein
MKPQGAIILAIGIFIAVIALRGTYKTMFPGLFGSTSNNQNSNSSNSKNVPTPSSPLQCQGCVTCPGGYVAIPSTDLCFDPLNPTSVVLGACGKC